MEYTREDLRANSAEYDKNFNELIRTLDTPECKAYQRREERLNKRGVKIQQALGVFIPNPCPTASNRYCHECTGFYKLKTKEIRKSRKGRRQYRRRYVNCGAEVAEYECKLKHVGLADWPREGGA